RPHSAERTVSAAVPAENTFSLVTSGVLGRGAATYNITIVACDCGSPPLPRRESLRVRISYVNDKVPCFESASYTVCVPANHSESGRLHFLGGRRVAPDGWKWPIVLRHLERRGAGGPLVSISSRGGDIYALGTWACGRTKNFSVHVPAADAGVPSLSGTASVHIFILDEDNNVCCLLPAGEPRVLRESAPRCELRALGSKAAGF
ncbi:unnamed protein product, partial [Lepidochelys kempii]